MSHWIRASALVLVSTIAQGQDEEFTLRVEVPVVNIDVSVLDGNGRPVEGLTRDDFEIFENGAPREVRYFGSSVAPYHAYLLFDGSGSTQHKWDFMNQAVARFLDTVKPQDRVAIGVFDSRLRSLAPWREARSHREAAAPPEPDDSGAGGTTEFYAALERVLEDGFRGIEERRAIVVLTDGRDVSLYRELVERNRLPALENDRRFRSVYETAERQGVPVYFIAVNTDRNLETNTEGADEYTNLGIIFRNSRTPAAYLEQVRIRLERIAEVSGGAALFPQGIDEVVDLFQQIGRNLGQAYSLGYTPPGDDGSTDRRIQVRVKNPAYEVRPSRTHYRPSAPE